MLVSIPFDENPENNYYWERLECNLKDMKVTGDGIMLYIHGDIRQLFF